MPRLLGAPRRRHARASVRPGRRSMGPALAGLRRCRKRGTRGQRRARARAVWTRRSLFGFVLRIVVVLGVDGERLLGDLGLFEHFLGGGSFLLDLLGLFLDLVAAVAEEGGTNVRPLLRLGGAVMAGEGDAARVLRAREHLTDRDARVRRVVAHDGGHVLVAGADEVDETPADFRLEESGEVAIVFVARESVMLL